MGRDAFVNMALHGSYLIEKPKGIEGRQDAGGHAHAVLACSSLSPDRAIDRDQRSGVERGCGHARAARRRLRGFVAAAARSQAIADQPPDDENSAAGTQRWSQLFEKRPARRGRQGARSSPNDKLTGLPGTNVQLQEYVILDEIVGHAGID